MALCVLDHIFWEDAMSNLQRVDRLLSVKDIKALNGLTTDRIKAGDKLKLPAKSAPATPNSTATNLGTPAAPPPGTGNL